VCYAPGMTEFANQKILVVGGSSGIGFAAARLAAEQGATVTIASRSADRVAAAAAKIGRSAAGRTLDVTDEAAVAAFFADGAVWDHVIVTART
jgi:NAD(P)-dependent dehydrogenase (short-subunit alcohol dehydrogenase family)